MPRLTASAEFAMTTGIVLIMFLAARSCFSPGGKDDITVETDQLGGKVWQTLNLPLRNTGTRM